MKNAALIVVWLLGGLGAAMGQKNDYVWLSGYGSNTRLAFDTLGYQCGNVKMDFTDTPVIANYDSLGMNFFTANTTMSDTNGKLLFYTNDIYVANGLDETIANGDSLNAGYVIYVLDTTQEEYGLDVVQGVIAIPDVANPNRYYLFHSFPDTLPGSNGQDLFMHKILVTLVDMSANGGLGQVIYKNQPLLADSIGSQLQAVKHGNGRDWWLLVQKRTSNCFYRILLDSLGPHVMPDLNCTGATFSFEEAGAVCFSPDGSKYVLMSYLNGINIYDFDRCTGILSNAKNFPLPVLVDSEFWGFSVAISPNSRYLYAALTDQLYQFDLWNPDVFSTLDTVGIYNGAYALGTPGDESVFDLQQLAPDGKIYMTSGGNTANIYHVINDPDESGEACNFVQGGFVLPALTRSLPNYPNYRLGSLTQSQCDTLAGLNEVQRAAKEQILKIYPNPATDYTIVDYGFTDWNKAQPDLEIYNALGQTVYSQALPMYSGFQKMDVRGFAAGVYTVFIKRQGGVVASGRLVKE